jgi:hypothetical protein
VRQVSDRDLEHVWALYEGEMRWTDVQVGRILDALDELGLADDTLVVLLADHGDEFFEHGSLGHRQTLYEEVLQVPLVMRLPSRLPAGTRTRGLVSTIDVYATALALLGLPADAALTSRSVLPLVAGGDAEDAPPRAALGRLVRPYNLTVELPTDVGPVRVAGQQHQVLETYLEGTIKITRERKWLRASSAPPPAAAAVFEAESARMFRDELLVWCDLAEGPEPALGEQSADFGDPRARAALQRFHDRYYELLARRGSAAIDTTGGAMAGALRGLGYTGDDTDSAVSSDEYVLPPPGRDVLRQGG